MQNKVKINIAGTNYTIIGEKSKEEVEKIALFVDDEIKKITSQNYRLTPTMVATLVALNISSDYFDLKDELSMFEHDSEYPVKKQEELIKINENLEVEKNKLENKFKELESKNDILIQTISDLEKRYQHLEKLYHNNFNELKSKNDSIIKLQKEIIMLKDEYIKKIIKKEDK